MQRKSREILARKDSRVRRDRRSEERYSEDGRESVSTQPSTSGKKRRYGEEDGPDADVRAGLPTKVRKRSKFERISEKVHALLNEFHCIPAESIRDILLYERDVVDLFDPTNQKAYEAACQVFARKFNHFTLKDLAVIYKNMNPIFYANDISPFEYYHTRERSLYFIDQLLQTQYGEEDKIRKFLINLRDWFDLKGWECNPKINALCCIGPPNSGKNYFYDMLSALAYNVGHIGRVNNKTNSFALQECVGRRFIVGNEISMESGAREDFKKICEGSACNIRVKFQGDKVFTKCPVMLMSNFNLDICNDPHFRDVRLHTERWTLAPVLASSKKKPYPLCIFDVFEKYNVTL